MPVRTRFAPSPTGYLHIGGARTALYCWLQARHRGGEFVLRIEDTDRIRSTPEAVQAIIDGMAWLGLDCDEGPIFQTSRLARYEEVARGLLAAGRAYWAYETREEIEAMRAAAMARGAKPRYNGHYREFNAPCREDPNRVLRFKNPLGGTVAFDDAVKGRVEWQNEELDDLVLIRSDGYPTYNFAVVVDDVDMRITEVIRGDDHVNNTPRQINLYEALGAPLPRFAHLPMILGADGQKLSKRHGAVSVMQYREDGYLPEALLNYLVRLGWSHGDQEIFSRQEMIDLFDISDVNRSAARFDVAKLNWLNQQYLKATVPEILAPEFCWHLRRAGINPADGPAAEDVIVALRERVHTLRDLAERARVWYGPIANWDDQAITKFLRAEGADSILRHVQAALGALPHWTPSAIHEALVRVAQELSVKPGQLAQPLRVAITGTAVSPSIEYTVFLAGRREAAARIEAALEKFC